MRSYYSEFNGFLCGRRDVMWSSLEFAHTDFPATFREGGWQTVGSDETISWHFLITGSVGVNLKNHDPDSGSNCSSFPILLLEVHPSTF
jgi:hypothetical protein